MKVTRQFYKVPEKHQEIIWKIQGKFMGRTEKILGKYQTSSGKGTGSVLARYQESHGKYLKHKESTWKEPEKEQESFF